MTRDEADRLIAHIKSHHEAGYYNPEITYEFIGRMVKTTPDKKRPDWWPENPYPESVFTMTEDEYCESLPDEHLRARISGFCGRTLWNICERMIYQAMKDHEGEGD